jgi:DNA processing protein
MTMLKGIGPISARKLLDTVDSAEQLFYLKSYDLQHLTGLNRRLFVNSQREHALVKADKILEQHSKHNISSILINDEKYPQRLLHCPDAPLVLYKLGKGSLNYSRSVSVVGTRANTSYGDQVTRTIVNELSGEISQITSGLADGIDTIAHRESIQSGINTVAVLGHGLDRIYPSSNKELARDIIDNDGALISEFPFGVKPDRENFPKRNRIVAGITSATIVVESSSKGGSLITARLALDYNRDVFAVPGSLFSKTSSGCNALINRQGALPYLNGKLFLKEMGWAARKVKRAQRSLPIELNPVQRNLYDMIQSKAPISIDDIALALNVSISKLNVELLQLELKGVITCLPGCNYTT